MCITIAHPSESYCDHAERVFKEWLRDIRQKIADLRHLERVMSDMAARCTADRVPECPIIDALFDMRPVGGPRHCTSDAKISSP